MSPSDLQALSIALAGLWVRSLEVEDWVTLFKTSERFLRGLVPCFPGRPLPWLYGVTRADLQDVEFTGFEYCLGLE